MRQAVPRRARHFAGLRAEWGVSMGAGSAACFSGIPYGYPTKAAAPSGCCPLTASPSTEILRPVTCGMTGCGLLAECGTGRAALCQAAVDICPPKALPLAYARPSRRLERARSAEPRAPGGGHRSAPPCRRRTEPRDSGRRRRAPPTRPSLPKAAVSAGLRTAGGALAWRTPRLHRNRRPEARRGGRAGEGAGLARETPGESPARGRSRTAAQCKRRAGRPICPEKASGRRFLCNRAPLCVKPPPACARPSRRLGRARSAEPRHPGRRPPECPLAAPRAILRFAPSFQDGGARRPV